jgi:O-antigen/teichoic acid export membrane protein
LLISNAELASAYLVTALIVFSYSYRPLYWGAVNLLGFASRTGQLWKISFSAGAINLGLNFAFMPVWGYKTAIVTTFISLLFLGASGYRLKAFKELSKENYYPYAWLFAFIAGFVLLYFAVEWSWIVKIPLTVVILILMIVLVRQNMKDVNNSNSLLTRRNFKTAELEN